MDKISVSHKRQNNAPPDAIDVTKRTGRRVLLGPSPICLRFAEYQLAARVCSMEKPLTRANEAASRVASLH